MVRVISGAVLIEDDQQHFVYQYTCESCGYVDPTRQSHSAGNGGYLTSDFYCPHCHQRQPVEIMLG